MARKFFEEQGIRRRRGPLASGVTFVVYSDEAATVLADISATSGGSAIAGSEITTEDIASLGLAAFRFYGPPSGQDTLYLRCPADPTLGVQEIEADEDERLDALEAAAASGGIPGSIFDAKGDLIAASAADTAARLAVGADGFELLTDPAATAGLKWVVQPALNVKNPPYNALGDFSANDTSEIHAARDAAGAGGRLFFPPGTYLHDGLVNNQAGQVWELAPGAVLRLRNNGDATTVALTAAGAALVGGKVDGNKANQTTGGVGVHLGADDCRVEGVTVYDAKSYGIQSQNANRTRILRNNVSGTVDIGIFAEVTSGFGADVADVTIAGNTVDRSALGTGLAEGGIKVHGNTPRQVIGAKIHGNTVRMPASPTSDAAICIEVWGGAPRSVIADNTTYGGSMGVSLSISDNSSCTGNTVYGASLVGFEGARSIGVAYTGNTVEGAGLTASGFQFSNATVGHLTITGNTVKNLKAAALCLYANGVNDLTVVGNDFNIGAGNHCISLQNTQRFTIAGNTLTGAAGSFDGVSLDGASFEGAITGNLFIGLERAAFFISATTAVTFTDMAFVGNTLLDCAASVATGLSGGAALGARIVVKVNVGEPKDWWDFANNVFDTFGAGTPEAAVAAGVGSTFRRTDGGLTTTLYVKTSGTGNTGWTGK